MRARDLAKIVGWVAGILFALVGVVLVLSADAFQMVEAPTSGIIAVLSACALVAIVVSGLLTKEWVLSFCACGILAGPTFLLVRFGYVPAINAFFDDSPGRTHRVKIRRGFSARKGLLTGKIVVESWRGDRDGEEIQVQSDFLDDSPTHVELTLRVGALGYEWISAIKPAR